MMKKTFLLVVIALLPLGMWAQSNVKIGHVNSQELTQAMPEVKAMKDSLEKVQAMWEENLLKMREEYQKKAKEFIDGQATMPETLRAAKQTELQEMEQRIGTFNQQASLDLQKKQKELTTPILQKVQKAIDDVAKENGYTYIFDLSAMSIVYHSQTANDITPLVKKKLGL